MMPQVAEETQIQPEPSHKSPNHPDPIENPLPHLENSSTRTEDPVLSNTLVIPKPDSSIPMDPPPSVRSSPYPIRIREPKRQWESLQSIDTQQAEIAKPSSFSEAMESSDAHLWKVAIQEEYDSLMSNETWHLTPLPPSRTSIKSRWVFKPGVHGSPPLYKARLVAKSFSQRPGIDFEETFSPVVKYDTLRVILPLVAALDLDMSQLDVKTAFLYGEISEEIYLQQPEGYVLAGQENFVCRLQKCLYGLKQASRVWNRHIDSFIKKFGLQPSNADPCLYVHINKTELIFVVIWVDDCLVISNNGNMVTEIIEYLSKIFEMRCTPANHFVGLSITRSRQDKTLFLSQPDYIKKILKRFHMTDYHPKGPPALPGCRLTYNTEGESLVHVPYREAIGSLLYLSISSRPDIAFAVGQVAQFAENPQQHHWAAVRRIFAYLKGTQEHGIRFGPISDQLKGYTDSDSVYPFGISIRDTTTRRSTTGFIFLLHGGPVAWTSRRQPFVSLSSTEAEFVAASEATKEAVWLKRLMEDVTPEWNKPIPLMCDNQSAIQLIRNPVFHQTK